MGSYVKEHAESIGHTTLDAAGLVPGLGAVPDLINAGWYAAEGDKLNAGFSLVAAIPLAGGAAMAAKYGAKGANILAKAAKTEKAATDGEVGVDAVRKLPFTIQGKDVTHATYLSDDDLENGIAFTYHFMNGEEVRYTGHAASNQKKKSAIQGAQKIVSGRMEKGHDVLKKHSEEISEIRIVGVHNSKEAAQGAENISYVMNQVSSPIPYIINGREVALERGIKEKGRQLLNRTNTMSVDRRKAATTGRLNINAYLREQGYDPKNF